MIVLDPIYQAVEGDFNNDYRARAAYERLVKLAKQLGCAAVGICHAVKSPATKTRSPELRGHRRFAWFLVLLFCFRKLWRNQPRMVARMSCCMRKTTREHWMMVTNTAYPRAVKRITECEPETVVLNITGEVLGRPQEILEWVDAKPEKNKQTKTDIAVQFLLDTLEDEGRSKSEILELADAAGIKEGTLMLARSRLPIVAKKQQRRRPICLASAKYGIT